MSNWRPNFDPTHLYFVTTTAVQHAFLFQRDVIKRILVDALYYMRAFDRTELYAFVIMPNHIHFIIRCRDDNPLADVIRDFKINTARLTQSQTRLRGQQAAAELLDRELEATRMRMDQALVKAPFAGIVVERAPDPERLSPDAVICELWDDSALLIEMEILQHQLAYVYPGRPAVVALDFGREDSVRGIVASIEPGSLVPDPSGHARFKAMVKLDKTVPWLRPGMQVAVRVSSERPR